MIQRYYLEDLIAQDASGVVFRAMDRKTGAMVAVQRFFPFGATGGGLLAHEQETYDAAVRQLATLHHPSLRTILCGGCDPIDGIPFVVTEWIEGPSLQTMIDQGPLTEEVATELILQILDLCERLSDTLAKEAVWVETHLPSIIAGNPQSHRPFTFGISPLKWQSRKLATRELESIITLTEEIMGWHDKNVHGHAGSLAAWLHWLRHAAPTTSLHEAHEALAATTAAAAAHATAATAATAAAAAHAATAAAAAAASNPHPPAKKIVGHASRPLVMATKPRRSKSLRWLNFALVILAVGLGTWFFTHQQAKRPAQAIAQEPPTANPIKQKAEITAAPSATRLADDQRALAHKAEKQKERTLADQKYAASKNGGVIPWSSRELIAYCEDKEVVVEGVLLDVSCDQKRISLLFSKPPQKTDPRGVVLRKSSDAELSAEKLMTLIGKKVRLHGIVDLRSVFGNFQTEIAIKDRAAIEVLE